MAALTDADRQDIWANVMREKATDLTKADLRAVVNAIDDYMESTKTAMNNAIPQPGRTVLSTREKARILVHIVERRWLREP